jgi:hypothetical protein
VRAGKGGGEGRPERAAGADDAPARRERGGDARERRGERLDERAREGEVAQLRGGGVEGLADARVERGQDLV